MNETARPQINNQILSALSDEEFQKLSPHLESVSLPHGLVLYEMGSRVVHVYFPTGAVVSLVTQMRDGKIVEVGLVGKEGMTGLSALLGEPTSPERAIVQIPNGGIRAKLSVIKEHFKQNGQLQSLLLAYARKFMMQVAQTAACNATHTVEERLSRWLLMCQDRVNDGELKLTQEFIAEMLATRRPSVSIAAMALQTEGLIKYNRGHIKILDQQGLESFACECYQVVRDFELAQNATTLQNQS